MADRIQHIGFLHKGEVIVLKAGRLRYRLKPERYQTQLTNGQLVSFTKWHHIEFTIDYGFLDQQCTRAICKKELLHELCIGDHHLVWEVEIPIAEFLNELEAGKIQFYPNLHNSDGFVDITNIPVQCNYKNIDLVNARRNGRYPLQIPINFQTINPYSAVPSWVNR